MIATPPELEWLLLFLAQQHVPEVVWVPEWQRHDNGARAMRGMTVCVPEPMRVASFMRALFGEEAVTQDGAKLTTRTPLGALEVTRGKSGIRSVSIDVADLDGARRCVTGAGIAVCEEGQGFTVSADDACGVALEFVTPHLADCGAQRH